MPRVTALLRVAETLRQLQLVRIGEAEWAKLRAALPDLSGLSVANSLARLDVEVQQPWRGLDTSSLVTLESSLSAMTDAYLTYPNLQRPCRKAVITVKDKTRFAARNSKVTAEKRALKLEMIEWMLVWLGDPRMFAEWTALRKSVLETIRVRSTQP